MKRKVLFLSPLPPPFAGLEVSSEQFLNSPMVELCDIYHVKSNIRSSNLTRELLNIESFVSVSKILYKCLAILLSQKISVFYFLLTSNRKGFCRDFLYFLLAFVFQKKIIIHYKGSNFLSFYKSENFFFKSLIRLVFKNIFILLVESSSIKLQFQALLASSKILALPNGIDLTQITFNYSKKIYQSPIKFIYTGNVSYAKGFYDLISVYNLMMNDKLDFELHIVGEIVINKTSFQWLTKTQTNNYRNNYNDINSNMLRFLNEKKENVFYYGSNIPSDHIYKLLGGSDVFIFLSYSEGFSLSILEALAFGLPIIMTPVGASVDYLNDVENCLYVPVGQPEVVLCKLKYLLSNDTLMNSMRNNNRRLAEEIFDINVVGKNLAEVFNSI